MFPQAGELHSRIAPNRLKLILLSGVNCSYLNPYLDYIRMIYHSHIVIYKYDAYIYICKAILCNSIMRFPYIYMSHLYPFGNYMQFYHMVDDISHEDSIHSLPGISISRWPFLVPRCRSRRPTPRVDGKPTMSSWRMRNGDFHGVFKCV